jgi:hypothetical protein
VWFISIFPLRYYMYIWVEEINSDLYSLTIEDIKNDM